MKLNNLFIRSLALITTAFFISACSHDVTLKPAPLSKFAPTLATSKQWTYTVSMRKTTYLRLTPAHVGNKIFVVGTGGEVKAIDANSGKLLWQNNTKLPLSSGISANSKALFVGTANGVVIALQQLDGRMLWQTQVISDVSATPAANDDTVVVRTGSGRIDAFRAQNGAPLWNYVHQQEPSLVLRGGGNSAPKISAKLVICGFANGEVVALNINNGEAVWQQQAAIPIGNFLMERRVDIIADPVVAGGVVYISAYQGGIAAIDIRSGGIIWRKDLSSTAGIAVDENKIYVIDNTDRLWGLHRSSGDEIWHSDSLMRRGLSTPAANAGLLMVGDASGYIHWLSGSDGKPLARDKVNSSVVTSPLMYNRRAVVIDANGSVTEFRW